MSQKNLNHLAEVIATVQADPENGAAVYFLRCLCEEIAKDAPVPHLLTLAKCVYEIGKEVDKLQAQEN